MCSKMTSKCLYPIFSSHFVEHDTFHSWLKINIFLINKLYYTDFIAIKFDLHNIVLINGLLAG